MAKHSRLIPNFVAWIFGVQAFFVFPWYLGAIVRNEQSLWVWREYPLALLRFGRGEAFLTIYLYLLFYLTPFFGAVIALQTNRRTMRMPKPQMVLIGIWAIATMLVMFRPCVEFMRNIPLNWNGWIIILWSAGAILSGLFLKWAIQQSPPNVLSANDREGRTVD